MVTCSDDSSYRIWRVNSKEFDDNDRKIRGFAELCSVTDLQPNQSSLKRKYHSRHVSKCK